MSRPSDSALVLASAAVRAVAVGISGVILALHLAALGAGAALIGLAISLGLAGCAVATAVVTVASDRWGRRRALVFLSLLLAAGGFFLATSTDPAVVLAAALFGMVNGMGRDRGAGLTVEQAILGGIATPEKRTMAFARYNVAVDAGHAVGALLGGLPALLRTHHGMGTLGSYQWTWMVYGALCLCAAAIAGRLSRAVETEEKGRRPPPLSPATRSVIARFAGLSALDSLGGGFLTTALLSYWFFQRFGVDETVLGPLFFAVRVLNGISHLGAAWLARRIGLVNTMVWTHVPSSLLLMTVPIAPSLPVAIALFLIREAMVEMDVPTRQSYIVAVVGEAERMRAAGISNLARSIAWATAPVVAGGLMRSLSLSAPLLIGPGLKVAYDLLLYRAFRHLKPPEERGSPPIPSA